MSPQIRLRAVLLPILTIIFFVSTAQAQDSSRAGCPSLDFDDLNEVSEPVGEAAKVMVRLSALNRMSCLVTYTFTQRSALNLEFQALVGLISWETRLLSMLPRVPCASWIWL